MGRARMMTAMQRTVGNARLGRMVGWAAAPPAPMTAPPPAVETAAAGAQEEARPAPEARPETEVPEVPATEMVTPMTEVVAVAPPAPAEALPEVEAEVTPEAPTETAPPTAAAKAPPEVETEAAPTEATVPGLTTPAAAEALPTIPAEITPPVAAAEAPPEARAETAPLTTAPMAKPAVAAPAETTPAAAAAEVPPEAEAVAAPSPREAIAPAISAVRHRAAGARRHPPASAPVASAQAAAINPETEQTRSAAAQTVENLDEAEAREVERKQFKDKLREALRAATPEPKTESEAERVMETGAKDASNALRGELATERDAAAGPLRSAADTEVPPSEQPAPPKTELQPEQVGPPPAPVSAAPVVPAPLPPERLDYSSDRAPADQLMAENDITKEQLEEGNEPAFGPALEARAAAEEHEATAEARYRQSESKLQDQAQGKAQQALTQGLTDLHSERELRIGQVAGQQTDTKSKDAAERKRITDEINKIKDNTRADVNSILDSMETKAANVFEAGLKRAEEAYEDAFEEAKGGWVTWWTTWGEDWKRHIEASLATARRRYLSEVDVAIDEVADLVGTKLAEARQRVADGRKEVEDFVKGLDESVRKYGEEALEAVSADFDAMETEIDQRRDGLIDKLTQQYKDSYERMSAMEERVREENKSLWQRVYDATVGVIEKIIEFKNMLLGVLGRAADVIGDIIAHPIRFLGNLVDGVKLGLENFVANIGRHLEQALMSWLFGTLAEAGIQLPEQFDLKGILSLVLQVLGLTYANIRKRAVDILGEELVSRLEQVAEIFRILITEGPGGLWEHIKEKIGDLKAMVIDEIKNFVIVKIIIAGIKWVVSLLNPAAAFIKACMAIYDIIKFFIERGSQILALVNAVLDSLAAIVSGNISVAAKFVEDALAKALPVVISFLASLLGLGGISARIRSIIGKIQRPINKAIDWVIQKAVKLVKAAGRLLGFGREEPKAEEEAPETDDPEHDAKVEAGKAAIDKEEQRYLEEGKISKEDAEQVSVKVQREHPVFKSITVVDGGETWDYNYVASPGGRKKGERKAAGAKVRELIEKLEKLKRKGADRLIGFLRSKEILPQFKHGFIFQAERALYYHQQGLLRGIEVAFEDPKTGRVSRFDLIIKDPENKVTDDGSVVEVVVEVKNWTGFENWDEDTQEARLDSLLRQLRKYQRSGNPVQLDWKGIAPERVKKAVRRVGVKLNEIT